MPLGDEALLVTFAEAISWEVGELVQGAASRIRKLARAEITDVVPSYTTLGVYFNGSAIAYADVAALVAPLLAAEEAIAPRSGASILEIPVRYDGPDLLEVA